jgi:seryl-tRNA synthetase
MIDLKALRANPEPYKKSAKLRNITVDIDRLLELDGRRAKLIAETETLRSELNVKGKPTPEQLTKLQATKAKLEPLEAELKKIEAEHYAVLIKIPNLVADDVPEGKDDTENVVVRKVGEPTKFDFKPKEHWELGEALGVINTEKAAEVTGSRFAYLTGGLAKLQFALIQFVINVLTDEETVKAIVKKAGLDVSSKPFTLVVPPTLVRRGVVERVARLQPIEDRYRVVGAAESDIGAMTNNDLMLAGTAEHALAPYHMDETLSEQDLPLRYIGYSTAFRGEAGSYGKDVKGILRMHQFDKLEMESFSTPETGQAEQDFLVAILEYLMQTLELPYQVVAVCTGDMGDPDFRQFDIETWMPGQDKYRETHSADWTSDFQSRGLATKVRRKNGGNELVHMNDATAAAVGRMLIAIMENYQQKDGSIKIPAALKSYFGGDTL